MYPWVDKKAGYYAIYVTEGKVTEFKRSYPIVKKLRPLIIKYLESKKDL